MDNSTDLYDQMWQTLHDNLTKPLENRSESELHALHKLLGMIRNHLIYSSPGLFPQKPLSSADMERVEACNFWLIQQLFHLLVEKQYSDFDDDILALLKDFLSGCVLQQRWLFKKIARKYVEIVKGLMALKKPTTLEITQFTTSHFDLTTIDPNMQCTAVIVPAGSMAEKILDILVKILTNIVNIVGATDPKLIQETSECVMSVLDRGNLSLKLRALEFFRDLFKNASTPLSIRQKAEQLGLLIGIEAILRNLAFWFTMEKHMTPHLEKLEQIFPELSEIFRGFIEKSTKHDCEIALEAMMRIIGTFYSIHKVVFEKIKSIEPKFIAYAADLIAHASLKLDKTSIENILKIIPQNCDAMKLLEFAVEQEVQTHPQGDSILARSKIWQEIYSFVKDKTPEKENFPKFLLLFRKIIRLGGRISCKTSTMCFGDEINNLIDLFRKSIEWCYEFNFLDIHLFILIAQDVTLLRDFRITTDARQTLILEVILCPLSKIIQREWRNLPRNTASVIFSTQSMAKNQLQMELISLRTLFYIQDEHISPKMLVEVKKILREILQQHQNLTLEAQECLFPLIVTAAAKNLLDMQEMYENFYAKVLLEEKFHVYISKNFNNFICVLSGEISLDMFESGSSKFTCKSCEEYNEESPLKSEASAEKMHILDSFMRLFHSTDKEVLFHMIQSIKSLIVHFPRKFLDISLLRYLVEQDDYTNRENFAKTLPLVVNNIYQYIEDEEEREKFIREVQEILLDVIIEAVKKKGSYRNQNSVLMLVDKFSQCPRIPEESFVHFFKMIFFIINTQSDVTAKACRLGHAMCIRRRVTPLNMLLWYKENMLRVIITLSVGIYISTSIGLSSSLSNSANILGYQGTKEFIEIHYTLIIAIILPSVIKYPKCEKLLEDVCEHTGKELPDTLCDNFVTIYNYLFVHQTPEINKQCIDYVLKITGKTLYDLLHKEITRTIPEVLLYYHKKPEIVMQAFQILLSRNEVTLEEVAKYISSRFLGSLSYFEMILINTTIEKQLKREALLSLGDIVRLMGPQHITPYRFKVLTVLKTALTVNDNKLKKILASVWTIFLHTVDIQCLGPLLSTIVVYLEPLFDILPQEVTQIFHYLIVENRNMLNSHFGDLFFIKNTKLDDSIKAIVSTQVSLTAASRHTFPEKFENFRRHINHENLCVRMYGFTFLAQFFAEHRKELNRLIFDNVGIDAMLIGCLETIMQGCRHVDESLQLAAGITLGELGALEPSHLPPNYAPQKTFALTIHSDEFAIMALAELCRAYQLKKDSHNVDSLSLAIQEILRARGVVPDEGKKLDVWQAIPERMRQLMQPLLTSCYEAKFPQTDNHIHPVFGSPGFNSLGDWTFMWASNMIQHIDDENTKYILISFRPSIKYDMQALVMFLPYVILHTLQSCKEEYRKKIFEEFQKVFTTVATVANDEMDVVQNVQPFRGKLRTIRSITFTATGLPQVRDTKEEEKLECAKMAFNQLDFIENWLQHFHASSENPPNNAMYTIVQKFLDQFDRKLLARGNFNVGEYERSLQCIEEYLIKFPEKVVEELGFLAKIHAELMDPDSVEGAMRLMPHELPLTEQILLNSVTGRLSESAVCFEKIMQEGKITPSSMNLLVQYYLALDQPETALVISQGLLTRYEDFDVDKYGQDLLELRSEALWQMGNWDDLDDLIVNSELADSDGWGVRCGSLLLAYRKEEPVSFAEEMEKTRLSILKSLGSAEIEQNTYQKGYADVLKLHMVTEIEKSFEAMIKIMGDTREDKVKQLMDAFFSDWAARLELLQPSTRIVEPVLRLRRIILTHSMNTLMKHTNPLVRKRVQTTISNELGKLWLKSAELARKERLYQKAQLYLLNLEKFNRKDLFLERAKLLWSLGDHANTFQVLERGLDELMGGARSPKNLPQHNRILYAEGKLLVAMNNAESMHIHTDLIINHFKGAIEANDNCEKSHVHYAQFLDKLYNALPEDQQSSTKGTDLLKDIMLMYGRSLQYGCNYLYQSMPRLLSIWLDYTALPKERRDNRVMDHFTELALRLSNSVPSYMFFTAFSQLVSRICHPSTTVYNVLKTILIKLILDYPQQSLWMILSVLKSSYASRSKRCIEVLNDPRLKDEKLKQLISDFNRLAEKLIELTNKNIPNHIRDPKVSNLVPQLPELLKNPQFSQIVIPAQKFMQAELPSIRDVATKDHNAFPRRMSYIRSIKNDIVVLRSLQRPRKVIFVADDGVEYSVLMKPKDDLRKDFRLMEFNAVVNQYLKQDPEARQRRLHIRTYSVLPLNEECGIIEWVSNLTTLRSILYTLYRRHGLFTDMQDIKKIENLRDKADKDGKKDIFINLLLQRHPPILREWFRNTFTTPFNWYQARSSYVRTTAVMSMVGYILGLGDRHGENILFDHTNGDVVHVDFNCLFNKGETLGVPEVVPFRLTHNMIHAMGPLGVEGLYRKCCEVTLHVLQAQTSTLMSVLRPFVYDPLVSWNRREKERSEGERTDPQALANLNHIEDRLKGFVKINKKRVKIPLSTEGQVNFLIKEATDPENLSAMYIGWGAFL